MAPELLNPIAVLMLDDLRRAATYLEVLAEGTTHEAPIARRHATRLWCAAQVVERLVGGIEQMIAQERSLRAYESGES